VRSSAAYACRCFFGAATDAGSIPAASTFSDIAQTAGVTSR
jgi:hypothetical protein